MSVVLLDAITAAARSGASRVETLRKLRDQGATLDAVSRIFDAVKYPAKPKATDRCQHTGDLFR